MQIQTLPSTARKYSAEQLNAIDGAVAKVARQWQRMGTRFDSGWSLVGPSITAMMFEAQRDIATRATAYIPMVLEETGQTRYVAAAAETNIEALVGVTGAGYPVTESLSTATVVANRAVAGGQTAQQALATAGTWLQMATTTILADTARASESVGRYTRNVGYVRMVHGGACGRCVVMAGKWYRTNAGFLRHPRCQCTHIPASEDVAGSWQTNPDTYFHSRTDEEQIKLMGSKANAQAVLDGADIGQVVNAYRRSSGMQVAQVSPIQSLQVGSRTAKFTTEGTTRRGSAYRAMQSHGAVRSADDARKAGERYFRARPVRVMPETIARTATSSAERIRLLKLYGWIL